MREVREGQQRQARGGARVRGRAAGGGRGRGGGGGAAPEAAEEAEARVEIEDPPADVDPLLWTPAQVGGYLKAVNLDIKVVHIFVTEQINGLVFLNLNSEKLAGEPFSIKTFAARETVLGAVARLNELSKAFETTAPPALGAAPGLSAAAKPWAPPAAGAVAPPAAGGAIPYALPAEEADPSTLQASLPLATALPTTATGALPAALPVAEAQPFFHHPDAPAWDPDDGGPPVGLSWPLMPPPPPPPSAFVGWSPARAAALIPPQALELDKDANVGGLPLAVPLTQLSPADLNEPGLDVEKSPASLRYEIPSPLPMRSVSPAMSGPASARLPGPNLLAVSPGPERKYAESDRRAAAGLFGITPDEGTTNESQSPVEIGSPPGPSPALPPRHHAPDWHDSPEHTTVEPISEFSIDRMTWGQDRRRGERASAAEEQPAWGAGAAGHPTAGATYVGGMAAPPPFHQVPAPTNLHRPPRNWLDDDERVAPPFNPGKVDEPPSREFAAAPLLMAAGADICAASGNQSVEEGAWEGGGGPCRGAGNMGVDFIAPAENMKRLFMAPFNDQSLALSIHRIGDSLVLEQQEARQQDEAQSGDNIMMSKLLYYSLLADQEHTEHPPEHVSERDDNSPPPLGRTSPDESNSASLTTESPQRGAVSSGSPSAAVAAGTPAPTSGGGSSAGGNSPQSAQSPPDVLTICGMRPVKSPPQPAPIDPTECEEQPEEEAEGSDSHALIEQSSNKLQGQTGLKWSPRPFQRNLRWRFHDLNILLGSNPPVMRQEESGAEVMLRLRDADRPFSQVEALEMWLDNVMSDVPQVAICFHRDGEVQGYQLIGTADIPSLAGAPTFEPTQVQDYAVRVLHWLKDACKEDAGSYLLVRDGGALRLYDLGHAFAPGGVTGPAAAGRLLSEPPGRRSPLRWDEVSDSDPITPLSLDGTGGQKQLGGLPLQPMAFPVGMMFLRMGAQMVEMTGGEIPPEAAARAVRMLVKAVELLSQSKPSDVGLLLYDAHYHLATAHVLAGRTAALPSPQDSPLLSPASKSSGRSAGGKKKRRRGSEMKVAPGFLANWRTPEQMRREEAGLREAHEALEAALAALRVHVAESGEGAEQRVWRIEERIIHCRLELANLAAAQERFGACLEWVASAEKAVALSRRAVHTGAHRRALPGPPGGGVPPPPGAGFGGDPAWLAAAVVRLIETLADAHHQVSSTLLGIPAEEVAGSASKVLAPHQEVLDRLLREASKANVDTFLSRCDPLSPDVDRNIMRALELYFVALTRASELTPQPREMAPVEKVTSSPFTLQKKIGGMYNMLASHVLRQGRFSKALDWFQSAYRTFKSVPNGELNTARVSMNLGKLMQSMAGQQQRTEKGSEEGIPPQEERCINQAIHHYQEAVDLLQALPLAPAAFVTDAQRLCAGAQAHLGVRYYQTLPALLQKEGKESGRRDLVKRASDLLSRALQRYERDGSPMEVATTHAHLGQLYCLLYKLRLPAPGGSAKSAGDDEDRNMRLAESHLEEAEKFFEGDARSEMYLKLRTELAHLQLIAFTRLPADARVAKKEKTTRLVFRHIARCRPWLTARAEAEEHESIGEDITAALTRLLEMIRSVMLESIRFFTQGEGGRGAKGKPLPLQPAKEVYKEALQATPTLASVTGVIVSLVKHMLPGESL
eukprot:Hpha_TRINITY_DN11789_c0_g2::TRINITY_DN11789_c0_g2_i1::g.31899::m.31899